MSVGGSRPDDIDVHGCGGASAEQGRGLAARADGVRADRAWSTEGASMSEGVAFERILASLHEVALDPAHWSSATALIDEALCVHGSNMVFGDGRSDEDIRIYFAWSFFRGERHRDLERDYFENYYALDERVPRLRHLDHGRGAGRNDADGGSGRHRRRGRPARFRLHVPMDQWGERNPWGDGVEPHAELQQLRPEAAGAGEFHGPRGLHGVADQRRDAAGGAGRHRLSRQPRAGLVRQADRAYRQFIRIKGYRCEACDWSIAEDEREVWGSSFELHHLVPIHKLQENETRVLGIEDFAVLLRVLPSGDPQDRVRVGCCELC